MHFFWPGPLGLWLKVVHYIGNVGAISWDIDSMGGDGEVKVLVNPELKIWYDLTSVIIGQTHLTSLMRTIQLPL
jgi:hypothetical protein